MILSAKFVVVFKAKIKTLDSNYFQMAQILEDIHAWHLDADHHIAQNIGKEKWYEYFSVEICEITRSYSSRHKQQYNPAG